MQTTPRLTFVALYTLALTYLVFVEKSLISQLFFKDMAFAFLLGWAIRRVLRPASSGIDKALVVTSCIVVLVSMVAPYFTFVTGSSNDFADFADLAYGLAVHLTTTIVCMFFPFSALAAVGHTDLKRYRRAVEIDELAGRRNQRGFRHALERGGQCDPAWLADHMRH